MLLVTTFTKMEMKICLKYRVDEDTPTWKAMELGETFGKWLSISVAVNYGVGEMYVRVHRPFKSSFERFLTAL